MNSIPDSEILDSMLLAQYVNDADDRAFDRLFSKYRRLVFGAGKLVLGNDESAEDAVGATFLLLTKRASRLSNRASIAGWLFDTATLTAKNVKRMEEAQLKKLKRIGEELTLDQRSTTGSDLEWDDLLAELPSQARKLLLLKFVQGFTYAEIGQAAGCTEDAARQRVQRALRELSQRVTDSGSLVTLEGIEQVLANIDRPSGALRPWLTRQSSAVVGRVDMARRVLQFKIGAGAMVCAGLLASPAILASAGSARSNASKSPPAQKVAIAGPRIAPVAKGKQAPALNGTFTLVYDEVAKAEGLPDQHDTITFSFDGLTLFMERNGLASNLGDYVSLFQGSRLQMFIRGAHLYGLPPELKNVPMTLESDYESFDPSKTEWLQQKVRTQAPPLMRFTPITNIPPVGASLPNATFEIRLDGGYSWFMGEASSTVWDSQGHLTHFGAYDTFYDLSNYRMVGRVPVAGKVIVTRTSGDFRGPNTYILKSASPTALPAARFRANTYETGELMGTETAASEYPSTNSLYVPANEPMALKQEMKALFARAQQKPPSP